MTVRVYELIRRKRDGEELKPAEIRHLVQGFVQGDVPDYQMSAFLMAVYFQGLSESELLALTEAMIDSGERLELSHLPDIVDKHSTGGVGDKTTLVLIPLVAACGARVLKMSGRGLGFTGGTIDKLESFPGLRTELSLQEMIQLVQTHGACIGAQTGELTPADQRIYALRDVTATVESIPLVTASVMSKKLAAGAQGIVLDVKCGRGAFAKERETAEELARAMVNLAQRAGRRAVALITAMDQPLGHAVGNALEVKEAIATLKGEGPEDLRELVLALGAEMLILANQAPTPAAARRRLVEALESGAALDKLKEIVQAQGGDARACDDPSLLPAASHVVEVRAARAGYVQAIDAYAIGMLSMGLGAGRAVQGGSLDLSVGLEIFAKIGQQVEVGDVIGFVHGSEEGVARQAVLGVQQAIEMSEMPVDPPTLVLGRVPAT